MAQVDRDRRRFTLATALAALGGVTITISGCGSSGGSGTASPNQPSAGDVVGRISDNHGHTAVITAAQLAGGGSLLLNIQGDSSHPHTVSLSAADISAIAGGQTVSRASSLEDGHTHTVTFSR